VAKHGSDPMPKSAAIRFQPSPFTRSVAILASAVNFCRQSESSVHGPQPLGEFPTTEMLQNKKTALLSDGPKSFVCMGDSGKRLQNRQNVTSSERRH
jgi:hypothetical protein